MTNNRLRKCHNWTINIERRLIWKSETLRDPSHHNWTINIERRLNMKKKEEPLIEAKGSEEIVVFFLQLRSIWRTRQQTQKRREGEVVVPGEKDVDLRQCDGWGRWLRQQLLRLLLPTDQASFERERCWEKKGKLSPWETRVSQETSLLVFN